MADSLVSPPTSVHPRRRVCESSWEHITVATETVHAPENPIRCHIFVATPGAQFARAPRPRCSRRTRGSTNCTASRASREGGHNKVHDHSQAHRGSRATALGELRPALARHMRALRIEELLVDGREQGESLDRLLVTPAGVPHLVSRTSAASASGPGGLDSHFDESASWAVCEAKRAAGWAAARRASGTSIKVDARATSARLS